MNLITLMNSKKIVSLIVFLSLFCVTSLVFADSVGIPNYGPASFCALLKNAVNYISGLVASLAVIMIVIAGIMYLVSGGDPGATGNARKALIYAVAGIAIALAASGIVDTIVMIVRSTSGGMAC